MVCQFQVSYCLRVDLQFLKVLWCESLRFSEYILSEKVFGFWYERIDFGETLVSELRFRAYVRSV